MKIRKVRGDTFLGDKEVLDFQVNDQTYFLGLSEEEGEWEVFVSTPNGPQRVPVYVDVPFVDEEPLLVEDKHRRKIVN